MSGSTFSAQELERYFDYVQLPSRYRPASKPPLDASLLTALHVHQISTIPYENLSIHYSANSRISLDPHNLFEKIVASARGRGGYCMEASLLFYNILKAIGFDVYPTGVRIRPRQHGVPVGDYIGLVHIVNIVTLANGSKYVLDAAFGGDGPTKPLPLQEGVVTHNLGTQEVRLIYDHIPQIKARPSGWQKYWIYQYRNGVEKEWNSFYCFTEMEYLLEDFDVMNFFTGPSGDSFQTFTVLTVKFIRNDQMDEKTGAEGGDDPKITGKIMLVNETVKRNLGGKTETVKICRGEEERVLALKDFFQMELTDEEIGGIKGKVTELK